MLKLDQVKIVETNSNHISNIKLTIFMKNQ